MFTLSGYLSRIPIEAGRTPYEFEQLLLFQLPLVFTFNAFVEPLLELQFGERSHQLVAKRSAP